MSDPIRAALERLHQYAEMFPEHDTDAILAAARTALAGQPTPPAEGEVAELLAELEVAAVTVESEGGDHEAAAVRRAAELLQQQETELQEYRKAFENFNQHRKADD